MQKKRRLIHQSSILFKYAITFSAVLLASICVISAFFIHNRAEKERQALLAIDTTKEQTVQKVQSIINTYQNLSSYAILREPGGLPTDYIKYLKYNNQSIQNGNDYYRAFLSVAKCMYMLNKNIYSVYSFDRHGSSLIWSSSFEADIPFQEMEAWRNAADEAFGGTVLVDPYRSQSRNGVYLFGVVRAIIDVSAPDILGYFAITINAKQLENICAQMQAYSGQNVYILGEQDQILCRVEDGDSVVRLEDILKENNSRDILEQESTVFAAANGNAYIVSAQSIPDTNWTLFTTILRTSISSELNRSLYLSLLSVLLLLVTVFLLCFRFFYTAVIRPVNKLVSIVRFSGFFPGLPLALDEVSFLNDSFTQFSNMMENLQTENYIRQKKLELELLQIQINPHFLYNTLESIHMMTEINGDGEAARMTLSLSKILRYSIDTDNKIVTVRNEIEILQEYIDLQQIRMDFRVPVLIDLEPGCYPVYLPKLTLQPIIENAITYGLSELDKRLIRILGHRTDEIVELSISDNGPGIPQEKLEELRRSLNRDDRSASHIGLRNVHRRVQLLYGDSYGLIIESAAGEGTTVRVRIPCKRGGS